MSQVTYRGNLSAKSFPFLSENFGRTVIVPQYDNTFNRQVQSDADSDKDIGIPQIYYAHNVLPTAQGLESIGYTTLIPGTGVVTFTQIFLIRDSGENKAYWGITSTGQTYLNFGGSWVLSTVITAGALVTTAFVSGVTYCYVQGMGCIAYFFGGSVWLPVVLVGLIVFGAGATVGICASAGYMIAWNATAVAWSSTVDPTDFVPSLITGAGGGQVEGAKGTITLCQPLLLGFIVYTTGNAVAALYSGNSRFPYQFREIVSSGGLSSPDLIASGSQTGAHYVYTTSGFQQISTSQTITAFSEVTDFISGKLFEDFDETTNLFSEVTLSTTMQKAIALISDRYLVISYGITSLTHALVYDLSQKRWGKLKIPHVQCFEFQFTNAAVTEIPKQSIGFLQANGQIVVVDFSVKSPTSNGVLILGKYQFVRPRLLQMEETNLENIQVGANFSFTLLSALDGKNYTQSLPFLSYSFGLFRKYNSRVVAVNHSLLFKGAFNIVSYVLVFNLHGKR